MELISKSGIFIYPIIALSIFGLFIIIERVVFFFFELPGRRAAIEKSVDADAVQPEINSLADEIRVSIRDRIFHEDMILIKVENEVATASRFLSGLAVVAQSAPLLGLLGTVVGMIDAFVRIETMGEAVSPSDLAGGIWEALLTTAAGLIVAIPAVIAHTIFKSQAIRYERWLLEKVFKIKAGIETPSDIKSK